MRKNLYQAIAFFVCTSAVLAPVDGWPIVSSRHEKIKKLYPIFQERLEKQELPEARETLLEILRLSDRKGLGDREYFRLVRELIKLDIGLKNFTLATEWTDRLEKEAPASIYGVAVQISRAELAFAQNRPLEAYRTLEKMQKFYPLVSWPEEGRNFLFCVEQSLDKEYGQNLLDAEKFYHSGLLEESAQLYGQVWNAIISGSYPAALKLPHCHRLVNKVRYRFGEVLYQLKEYDHLLEAFGGLDLQDYLNTAEQEEFYAHSLYLLAKTYREKGNYSYSVQLLQRYLSTKGAHKLPSYYEAHWELGCNYFALEQLDQAANHFKKMTQSPNERLRIYGHLFLIKFYLLQKDSEMASALLHVLFNALNPDDPFYTQALALQGQTALQKGEFMAARTIFQQAKGQIEQLKKIKERTPQGEGELSNNHWQAELFYHLAYTHLKLVENGEVSNVEQELLEAHYLFEKLQSYPLFTSRSLIGMMRIALLARENAIVSDLKVEKVLQRFRGNLSPSEAMEMGMLKAMSMTNPEEKQRLYRELVDSHQNRAEACPELFYRWATHCIEMGQQEIRKNGMAAKNYLVEAHATYQKLLPFLKKENTFASSIICNYLLSSILIGEKQFLEAASQFAKELDTNQYGFRSGDAQQYSYITAQIGLALAEEYGEYAGMEESRIAYETLLKDSSLSTLQLGDVLFGLGKVYFFTKDYPSAQKIWSRFLDTFSGSPEEGTINYFLAQCHELQGHDPAVAAALRRKMYTEFPDHPYAAKAYFNYFPFVEYLKATPEAIGHLQLMVELYSESPLLIQAHYLIGLSYKKHLFEQADPSDHGNMDLELALTELERAYERYKFALNHQELNERELVEYAQIAYASTLERAKMGIQLAEQTEVAEERSHAIEFSIKLLEELSHEIDYASTNKIVQNLWKKEPIPHLYEDALYHLALLYSQVDDELSAEEVRISLIDLYAKNQISQGYYLSRTWYDRGCFEMVKQQWNRSLEYFTKAKQAWGGSWSTQEQLTFWLKKSECYRHQKLYPDALRALAEVINNEGRTDFHNQAIYYRGEIYEITGKNHLAIKQYEALVKKEGEWANKAQERLMLLAYAE